MPLLARMVMQNSLSRNPLKMQMLTNQPTMTRPSWDYWTRRQARGSPRRRGNRCAGYEEQPLAFLLAFLAINIIVFVVSLDATTKSLASNSLRRDHRRQKSLAI